MTLLNSLMSSSSLLVSLENFLCIASRDLPTETVLLLFQFGFLLILLEESSLIAAAGISKATLNKSGKSRHPRLVLDLKGNALSFLPLSMM